MGLEWQNYFVIQLLQLQTCFMIEQWMNMYAFILMSAMNGSRVAKLLCHSIIAISDMFYDGIMDDYVHSHHDIW